MHCDWIVSLRQAIRNTEVALKSLSMHPGLEDLELILPSDLIHGRRSLWPVLALVHRVCAVEVPQSDKSVRNSRVSTRANGFKQRAARSQSPPPPPQIYRRGRSVSAGRGRGLSVSRRRSRSTPVDGSRSPVRVKSSPGEIHPTNPSPTIIEIPYYITPLLRELFKVVTN